jgi:hypothetical protein
MRALRLTLVVAGLGLLAASAISDPIVSDVAIAPALLVSVIVSIACLSGDLIPPRRRVQVVSSALSIVAPFPLLLLPGHWGPRAAGVALIGLQAFALARGPESPSPVAARGSLRGVVGALVVTTMVLLVAVVALAWYGSTYLARPTGSAFERAPYLTSVTGTQASFAWRARSGEAPVSLSALAPDGSVAVARDGRLTGLRSGTRYAWTANIAGRSVAAGSFATAPQTSAAGITLVSFGDYGSGNAHEYAVGRLAAAVDPALVLSAGDNAYLLAAPPLLDRAIFDPLRALLGEAPMVAALGEHDLAWRDGAAVISALHLPGHHYSVQYGPVQVVVLGLQADASALSYAAEALGRCQGPCPVRFVLTHRPIQASNPIMPLLRARRVAAILAGHLHRYERQIRAGVLEFTIGTGGEGAGDAAHTRASRGAQRSLLAYGFLRIEIARTRVTYLFIDQRGRIRDRVEHTITPP